MKIFLIILFLIFSGCAERANIRLQRFDNNSAFLKYNHGAFIESVDPEKIMEDYCKPLHFEIINQDSLQLRGNYRLQKRIKFKCVPK